MGDCFINQSLFFVFNCPFHFKPTDCLAWNPTPDKCYRLPVEEMRSSVISPHITAYKRSSHAAMNWRCHPLIAFLKVNMWADAPLLGSTAANCLSFPESIVTDYSALDHWNVPRRLPEFLSAASFITANVTAIGKHWFCCLLSLLFCPLLSHSKSHSILLPLLCSSVVFSPLCGCNLLLEVQFSFFHPNFSAVLTAKVSGNYHECVTANKY